MSENVGKGQVRLSLPRLFKAFYLIGAFVLVVGVMLGSPTLAQDDPTDKRHDTENPGVPSPTPGDVVKGEPLPHSRTTCSLIYSFLSSPISDYLMPGCDGSDYARGILGNCQERETTPSYYARPHENQAGKRNKLVLFLTGKGTVVPSNNQNLIHMAARRGFHAISLSYNNKRDFDACTRKYDPDFIDDTDSANCYAEYRDRIAFGKTGRFFTGATDPTLIPLPEVKEGNEEGTLKIHIDIDDTVKMRLKDALRGLVDEDSGGGWESYIDSSNNIKWRQIIVTGWSLGAGLAHHIATKKNVHAVGVFEFPTDPFNHDGDAADGTTPHVAPPSSGTTPACQYWAMYNTNGNDDSAANKHGVQEKREWLNEIGVLSLYNKLSLSYLDDSFLIDDPNDTTKSLVSPAATTHRFKTKHDCNNTHSSLTQDTNMWRDYAMCEASPEPIPNTDFFHFEAIKDMLCRMDDYGGDTTCEWPNSLKVQSEVQHQLKR